MITGGDVQFEQAGSKITTSANAPAYVCAIDSWRSRGSDQLWQVDAVQLARLVGDRPGTAECSMHRRRYAVSVGASRRGCSLHMRMLRHWPPLRLRLLIDGRARVIFGAALLESVWVRRNGSYRRFGSLVRATAAAMKVPSLFLRIRRLEPGASCAALSVPCRSLLAVHPAPSSFGR